MALGAVLCAACGGQARTGANVAPAPVTAAPSSPTESAERAARTERAGPAAPIHIAAGDFHTCALRGDGTVRCWGRNTEGQLGDGTSELRTTPVAVGGVSGATQLALGANSSCALLREGTIVCWGGGRAWGDGQTRSNVPPTPVAGIRGATQIDAGGLLTCAVLAGGKVRCWGDEGDPRPAGASAPPDAGAVEVSVAEAHACARMRDGSVRCWGDEPWNGVGSPSLAVARVAGATSVTTGDLTSCALGAAGGASCWGLSAQGELGREPDGAWHVDPVAIAPLSFLRIASGESHVCGVLRGAPADGAGGSERVYCWGSNADGELGRGTEGPPERPGPVRGLAGVPDELALGADHSCARVGGGSRGRSEGIWCWGANSFGQLGDGTTDRRTTPVRVAW
jgi:alpha-tubulin suppressor-like RCC1 family protein